MEENRARALSHVDEDGQARMVDVGDKPTQRRLARATGRISLSADTVRLVRENGLEKGDVLGVARIAGIQAAKRTAELIPLCHPLSLDHVEVSLSVDDHGVAAEARVSCAGRTGVEMEALTAAAVALLTVYDMCKAIDSEMEISDIRLVEKVKHDVD